MTAPIAEAGLKYLFWEPSPRAPALWHDASLWLLGTTNFDVLEKLFADSNAEAPVGVIVGVVFIIAGCLKISAVPFHMWTPDVYEGAHAGDRLLAVAPKIAAMGLFIRVMTGPDLRDNGNRSSSLSPLPPWFWGPCRHQSEKYKTADGL